MPAAAPESDPLSSDAAAVPRTTAIVVTWNAADHVGSTLSGLPRDLGLVVVDNGSTDGTPEAIELVAPHARILRNADNVGFAAAVNQALRTTPVGEYALLLNPDATLEGSAVESLVAYCDAHPDVAAASALILDPSGVAERYAGGREPTLVAVAIHELGLSRIAAARSLYRPGSVGATEDRDWVAGTCLLVRHKAIEAVGDLDEAYFLYAEDIDWCRRFRQAGWRVVVVGGAVAVHHRSSSVNRAGAWIDAHRMGSLDHYFGARHGGASLLVFRGLRAFGAAARAVLLMLVSWGRPEIRARARRRWHDARLALIPQRRP